MAQNRSFSRIEYLEFNHHEFRKFRTLPTVTKEEVENTDMEAVFMQILIEGANDAKPPRKA